MSHILLVEDDPALRRAFERMLKSGGHTFLTCATVAGGLEALVAGRFDMVLTDLNVEWDSGLRVVEAAKGKGVAVVLMSAQLESVSEAERPTFTLDKPFDPRELLALVEKLTFKGDSASGVTRGGAT